MIIYKAYKTELDPNNKQATALLKHAGAARWAYNWGLARKIEEYKTTGRTLSSIDLHKELVLLKKKSIEDGGAAWLKEISKWTPQEALRNLDNAYKNFFRCYKKKDKKKDKNKGFPKFKSRKQGIGSFTLCEPIHIFESSIQLPKIGKVKLKESNYLPTSNVKILSATISEKAGHWFVSLRTEQEIIPEKAPDHILGVDVGINSLAVTSDGEVFNNPRALKKAAKRLRFLQKEVSRKEKGSKNRQKATRKLGRQHYKVACQRRDAINKATTVISKQASIVVIESLNVDGMMKNHKLARAIGDAGMAEFHRQILYKVAWKGGTVLQADRFYPSSKTCSGCGKIHPTLTLADREFICPYCGLIIDRDLNAAINLKNLVASYAMSACCPGSSGGHKTVKLLVGQEPNTNCLIKTTG